MSKTVYFNIEEHEYSLELQAGKPGAVLRKIKSKDSHESLAYINDHCSKYPEPYVVGKTIYPNNDAIEYSKDLFLEYYKLFPEEQPKTLDKIFFVDGVRYSIEPEPLQNQYVLYRRGTHCNYYMRITSLATFYLDGRLGTIKLDESPKYNSHKAIEIASDKIKWLIKTKKHFKNKKTLDKPPESCDSKPEILTSTEKKESDKDNNMTTNSTTNDLISKTVSNAKEALSEGVTLAVSNQASEVVLGLVTDVLGSDHAVLHTAEGRALAKVVGALLAETLAGAFLDANTAKQVGTVCQNAATFNVATLLNGKLDVIRPRLLQLVNLASMQTPKV
jgi:hypothetical protein